MKPDTMPMEIALVLLTELLYGMGYNALVAYWMKHRLMHVSFAVVIGVAGTLFFPALAWLNREVIFWQAGVLLGLCFTASGVPMIYGSMRRTVRDDKKRRPLGNTAARARDEVVMELNLLAQEIAQDAKAGTLTVLSLPSIVQRLYSAAGMLKSI